MAVDRCPDMETLLHSLRGELSEKADQDLRSHLEAGCPSCHDALAFLQRWGDLVEVTFTQPPEEVLQRAIQIPETLAEEEEFWEAILLFDTATTALAGVRGSLAQGRRIAWQTAADEVELLLELGSDEDVLVTGQFRSKADGEGIPGLRVVLHHPNDGELTTTTDELGHFELSTHPGSGVHLEFYDQQNFRLRCTLDLE